MKNRAKKIALVLVSSVLFIELLLVTISQLGVLSLSNGKDLMIIISIILNIIGLASFTVGFILLASNALKNIVSKYPIFILAFGTFMLLIEWFVKFVNTTGANGTIPNKKYLMLVWLLGLCALLIILYLKQKRQIYVTDEKKKLRKHTVALMREIIDLYSRNKIAADDKYKGKTFRILAIMTDISENHLENDDGTIVVNVYIMVGKFPVEIKCIFDKTQREWLKKFSIGNELIIIGKFVDMYNWTDCRLGVFASPIERKHNTD